MIFATVPSQNKRGCFPEDWRQAGGSLLASQPLGPGFLESKVRVWTQPLGCMLRCPHLNGEHIELEDLQAPSHLQRPVTFLGTKENRSANQSVVCGIQLRPLDLGVLHPRPCPAGPCPHPSHREDQDTRLLSPFGQTQLLFHWAQPSANCYL